MKTAGNKIVANKYRIPCMIFVLLFSFVSLFSCEIKKEMQNEDSGDNDKIPLVTLMKLESDNTDSYLFDIINGAVSEAAAENRCFYNVYEVNGDSSEEITDALFDAASGNADLIICVGGGFYLPIDEVAPIYDGVSFLSVGAGKHSHKNVTTIEYTEEEAGFISGYIAVAQGYRKLGFLGTMEVPSVINSGCGFLQGVDCAAEKYGVQDEVTVNYVYTGSYTSSDYGLDICERWYEDGTHLVFTKGIGAALSASKAAKDRAVKLIAYDVNENVSLPSEALYIYLDYNMIMRGMISSFVSNGCSWQHEAAGSAYHLDAADGIYKYGAGTSETVLDEDYFKEALSVLTEGDFIPSVYEEADSFPDVSYEIIFYNE